jgi:SprT-like family
MRWLDKRHRDYRLCRNAVILAWRRVGLPELAFKTNVLFTRLGSDRIAEARFYGYGSLVIAVSDRYWRSASVLEKRTTLAHEVSHLASTAMHGNRASSRPHGRSFFRLLKKTGFYEAERHLHRNGPGWYRRLFVMSDRPKTETNPSLLCHCKDCVARRAADAKRERRRRQKRKLNG